MCIFILLQCHYCTLPPPMHWLHLRELSDLLACPILRTDGGADGRPEKEILGWVGSALGAAE